jgi:putative membrane protein
MKQGKILVGILFALALAMIAPQFVRGEDDSKAFDKRFVKEASEWGMAMDNVSRLVKENTHNEKVWHYGESMMDGERKMVDELRDIASHHDYHLADDMTVKQRETKRRLEKLHGADFDVEYMSEQRVDQQAMVDLFEQARKECVDDNLRKFADRKLPAIKQYRDAAEDLYKEVKDERR